MTELLSSFFIQAGVYAPLPSQGSPPKSYVSPSALDVTPSSQFDPARGVMLHFINEDSNLPSLIHKARQPPMVTLKELVVPEIPVTPRVAILQVSPCPIDTTDEPSSSPLT
ncbi:hypothetical protein ACFX14_018849 [Malus domestica]